MGRDGRQRRWGSRITRPDAEPTQNVVCFATPPFPEHKVIEGLFCGQNFEIKSNMTVGMKKFIFIWGEVITTSICRVDWILCLIFFLLGANLAIFFF